MPIGANSPEVTMEDLPPKGVTPFEWVFREWVKHSQAETGCKPSGRIAGAKCGRR